MQLRGPDSAPAEVPTGAEGAAHAPAAAALGAPSCAIIALSDDPLLLEALTGAALAGSAVTTSPSPDRFIDQLVARGASIALIDASSVPTSLKSFLAGLREQFPQLVLLLAGPAHLQSQFNSQLEDGTIFRFVHKPASSQRLRLFIDAALRQQSLPEMQIDGSRVVAAVGGAAPSPPASRRGGLKLGLMAGAVLAIIATAWVVWERATSEPAAAPAAQKQPLAPESTTAAAPAEVTAAPAESAEAQAAREAAARDAAARDTAARDATAIEQAQRAAQGARADQVSVYLQLARKRLASGALMEPADDSARSYLDSALALAPQDPEVRATSIAFGEALIAQVRRALASGDTAAAQRWLQACSEYRVSSATINELTAQLQRLQSPPNPPPSAAVGPAGSALDTAPAAAASAGTTGSPAAAAAGSNAVNPAPARPVPTNAAPANAAPANAPAANTATAGPPLVAESSLSRLSFVQPVYPNDALLNGISGWVDLEYTVTSTGAVADIVVLAAEPGNVFERAARSALAKSRYAPVMRDGVAIAQRTRLRVRFKP